MRRFFMAIMAMVVLAAGCGRGAPESAPIGVIPEPAQEQTQAQEAAPTQEPAARGTKLKVIASIFPPYDFVREIAGERVDLTLLLPPGAESHSYEPTPQDIIKIQECDVFIYGGGESDQWANKILSAVDTSGMTILPMMQMVDVVREELVAGMESGSAEHGTHGADYRDFDDDDWDDDHDDDDWDDHDDDDDWDDDDRDSGRVLTGGYDEHVWTSPENAKEIVEDISEALQRLDRENADFYRQNEAAYTAQLEQLDDEMERIVQNGKRRTLVFGDRFPLRYFAEEYDLSYYAAFPGCASETEPSAATVAFLIDKVRTEGIPVVFHIEFSNERMADTICEATGAKKALFHSCHNVSREDIAAGVSYLTLMRNNAEVLKEALQ